jgi:hypothetical protein
MLSALRTISASMGIHGTNLTIALDRRRNPRPKVVPRSPRELAGGPSRTHVVRRTRMCQNKCAPSARSTGDKAVAEDQKVKRGREPMATVTTEPASDPPSEPVPLAAVLYPSAGPFLAARYGLPSNPCPRRQVLARPRWQASHLELSSAQRIPGWRRHQRDHDQTRCLSFTMALPEALPRDAMRKLVS